ncbi:HypC/HybG/HupF family hydrogenase formation chaperone [Desulforamulus ruminis]|uniref:HypC/HybG/HupF family hydrogenase formation chaperone n=1 Tax=Desulforamulus ruminis TaxID=1564 RepID=UPI002FD930A0
MCLAVPMKITEITGQWGIAELAGVRQRVNLQLLEQASLNSYVLIHAGFAIQEMKETEALEILELLSGIDAAEADTAKG